MKSIAFICGFLSLCFLLPFQAQSQRLRDKGVSIKYISLPSTPVPLDYKTFSVEAGGEVLQVARMTPRDFSKDFRMQGFKKVSGYGGDPGHLHMLVDLGYLTRGKEVQQTRTSKTKDKDGNEVTVKKYYYSVPFTGLYTARIFDPNGRILSESSNPFEASFDSDYYKSPSLLVRDISNIINELTVEAAQKISSDAYYRANSALLKFDFRRSTSREQIYIIRKHASEDEWERQFENVEKQFESEGYYPDLESIREGLSPSIAYYERMAEKHPRGNKKQERIYKAANLNLATIYHYLEEHDKAIAYAQKVIDALSGDNKSRNLIRKIESRIEKMRSSGVNTLYYERDLSNALAPGQIAEQEAENEKMMEDNNANLAELTLNGARVEGKILLDKDADDLVFGEGGNIKFVVDENGELVEIDLTHPDVSDFVVAGRKFKKMKFVPMAKGQSEASLEILEEVYDSKSLTLYKYYPSAGALSDDKAEFAFQKEDQIAPLSLESTQFLMWERGLANYFGDCEDLKDMITEGEIEKTKEDLIKAARIYSELCMRVIKP